jgi:hypothetical protein
MLIIRTSQLTGITRQLDLPVSAHQLADWTNGTNIQDAMPELSAAQREFIMTGITAEEWEALVPEL